MIEIENRKICYHHFVSLFRHTARPDLFSHILYGIKMCVATAKRSYNDRDEEDERRRQRLRLENEK